MSILHSISFLAPYRDRLDDMIATSGADMYSLSHPWLLDVLEFAADAHAGQTRKYTGEPYIMHPIEVAMITSSVPHDRTMLAAALLHDVIEDTDRTAEDIANRFGQDVAATVLWLTNTSKPSDGNRRARKAIDLEHIGRAPRHVQTIKVADMLSNVPSSINNDPEFARVYVREKLDLLAVLKEADPVLRRCAWNLLSSYEP